MTLCNGFLDMHQKHKQQKEKINKLGFIKINNISSKDTTMEVKR